MQYYKYIEQAMEVRSIATEEDKPRLCSGYHTLAKRVSTSLEKRGQEFVTSSFTHKHNHQTLSDNTKNLGDLTGYIQIERDRDRQNQKSRCVRIEGVQHKLVCGC